MNIIDFRFRPSTHEAVAGMLQHNVFGDMFALFNYADRAKPRTLEAIMAVRYSGISFVYQFTAIFASGLTPLVATVLTGWADGEPWLLCTYFAAVGMMSALCTLWMHKMAKATKIAAVEEEETPSPLAGQPA